MGHFLKKILTLSSVLAIAWDTGMLAIVCLTVANIPVSQECQCYVL